MTKRLANPACFSLRNFIARKQPTHIPQRALACSLLGAVLGMAVSTTSAQSYPTQPIRMLVPFTAGGGTDILARMIGQKMAESVGQQIIVDNRPGGNSLVATEMVVRAPPDGYVMIMHTNNLTVNPTLYKKLNYDTVRDLAPVSLVAYLPHLLVVHPSVPANTLKEFVALAKSRPGAINFGTAGSGTVNHLTAELFQSMAGIKMTHVPYKGSGSLIPDLLGGHLEAHFAALSTVRQHVTSGKLRALALTTIKRTPLLPDLPTFDELGYKGYDFSSWFGVLAPGATPADIVNKAYTEIAKAARRPEVQERLPEYQLVASTPQEFAAFIKADIAKAGKIVRESGATID
jgi:tripartite-type tricarboxylate transporter receptor subunit TctC